MPRADRWLLAEAAGNLALARLAVVLLPFRRIAPHLGRPMAESSNNALAEEQQIAQRVSRAIRTMRRHVPWKSLCLDQAIAAQRMLHRRHLASTLYLGVARPGEPDLEAHAWLRHGPFIVVGRLGHQRFAVVGTFADEAFADEGSPAQ